MLPTRKQEYARSLDIELAFLSDCRESHTARHQRRAIVMGAATVCHPFGSFGDELCWRLASFLEPMQIRAVYPQLKMFLRQPCLLVPVLALGQPFLPSVSHYPCGLFLLETLPFPRHLECDWPAD